MKISRDVIHIILTGGTIDSTWDRRVDSIVLNASSDVPEFFKKFPLLDELKYTQVCMKDSRQLTDTDREQILHVVENSEEKKIIITHGRFTIVDTVKFLTNNLKRKDQVIILTGGTTPLKGFEMTDSPFNLGFAIAKVQDTEPGIYIAMKGALISSEQFQKDTKGSLFHDLFGN